MNPFQVQANMQQQMATAMQQAAQQQQNNHVTGERKIKTFCYCLVVANKVLLLICSFEAYLRLNFIKQNKFVNNSLLNFLME